jgi:peptidoglycan-associated lipoprotein
MLSKRIGVALLGCTLFFATEGCKKKVAVAPTPTAPVTPPPPPPTPPRPVIASFTAEPRSIERGQSAVLRWDVQGAESVSIAPAIGGVTNNGSRTVFPSADTEYVLTASGPGGSATASVSVSVTAPAPPPPPPPQQSSRTISERLATDVQDAYYDYDSSEIREDARTVLQRNADALKAILNDFPGQVIYIEGHADERGSAEYNAGLGDRRSSSAKDFLVQLGVPEDRLKTISYGKERPQCTEATEDCYQKNRRAHFSAGS